MNLRCAIELIILAAIWGASFIFMRVGSPEFGPVLFMALRSFIASIFLIPFIFITKQQSGFNGNKVKIFIVGIFNTAIPFVLFGYAALTLSAGVTSILNATTPMFGAIVAYLWFRDKLSVIANIGLLIGFVGVYLLMFDKISIEQNNILLPTLAALLASLCYGLSANFTKRYLTGIHSIVLASGSQIASSIVLLPLSLFFLPKNIPSNDAMYALLLIGVLCTGIAYVIFFRLIAQLGPAKAISVTYLIPAFGLFWGHIFLNEIITTSILIGCALILLGVALTTDVIKMKKPINDGLIK